MPTPVLVIPAPSQPSLAVAGMSARFPVRRIFCVGRNYADHAREMGHDPDAEPPFFFTKPGDAVVESGANIPYPPQTSDLHHEAELVVAIGMGGAEIAREDALLHVWGYAAGNDLTRRDLQAAAKSARRPWDMAKGFDHSAIIGLVHRAADGVVPQGRIRCMVDGKLTQDADLAEMIWPVADVIAFLSRFVMLEPGDLIMTGTPAGVGPIASGQTCVVEIDGLSPASVTVG
ncbi:fumarylacetoacetate hydrolase family protein [Pseudorhodobacter sp.]|uniref:fumarylacetoacetate hydrolase family protein n=1 Tax=Pseudorhodobacter sp. TaxID=1934400 RepID=UPI0026480545|nr:fumarylacetoacetate hydrolase family protein [Pseudorhodobacter sp.]MDN5785683.1 fumarylacetoacetate hydrolase family protein [Pseudorhodobacter sp.]